MLLSCATGAWAQEVSVATLQNVPADMIELAPAAQPGAIDLGQSLTSLARQAPALVPPRAPPAVRQCCQQRHARPCVPAAPATAASARAGIERAVFERQPIAVLLARGTRAPHHAAGAGGAACAQRHGPGARIEIIDRTIYATALVPFTPIRIVAELIDTGQQLPMDMVVTRKHGRCAGRAGGVRR